MNDDTTTRLEAARAAVAEAHDRLRAIGDDMARLRVAQQRRRDAVAVASAPRQEKRGLLARILRRGDEAMPGEAAELEALDWKIAQARADADAATTDAELIGEMLAELQADADRVHAELAPLRVELEEARFEAAAAEIEAEAVPQFLEAAEAFRLALARLVGAGIAHNALREHARAIGAQCGSPAGMPAQFIAPVVEVPVPGFGMEDRLRGHPTLRGAAFNLVRLDVREPAQATAAATLARWQAA